MRIVSASSSNGLDCKIVTTTGVTLVGALVVVMGSGVFSLSPYVLDLIAREHSSREGRPPPERTASVPA
ncbi:unnamed protein product [Amoebophrya sp. A25]|nr:unnamed protein product [Amoebophrya sp. A25]|eukprot:GSA25T00008464001.1